MLTAELAAVKPDQSAPAGQPAPARQPGSLEEWAAEVADEALCVLADADRTGRPDAVVERVADLHAVAVDLRDALREKRPRRDGP